MFGRRFDSYRKMLCMCELEERFREAKTLGCEVVRGSFRTAVLRVNAGGD
jgi:hypothetical protein